MPVLEWMTAPDNNRAQAVYDRRRSATAEHLGRVRARSCDRSLNHVRRGSGRAAAAAPLAGRLDREVEAGLERLAAEREVVAVDMPGFGGSPPLPRRIEPSAANLAAAVLDFYDSLGLEAKPGVAGISLGGWVAIECARQGGARLGRRRSARRDSGGSRWARAATSPGAARALRPLLPLLMRSERMRRLALAG